MPSTDSALRGECGESAPDGVGVDELSRPHPWQAENLKSSDATLVGLDAQRLPQPLRCAQLREIQSAIMPRGESRSARGFVCRPICRSHEPATDGVEQAILPGAVKVQVASWYAEADGALLQIRVVGRLHPEGALDEHAFRQGTRSGWRATCGGSLHRSHLAGETRCGIGRASIVRASAKTVQHRNQANDCGHHRRDAGEDTGQSRPERPEPASTSGLRTGRRVMTGHLTAPHVGAGPRQFLQRSCAPLRRLSMARSEGIYSAPG